MWPKALAQLIELSPHITRLLPLADRFLKDKATGDEAVRRALADQRQVLETAGESFRSGLAETTSQVGTLVAQQAMLQRQLGEVEKQVSTTRVDAVAARVAAEGLQTRLDRLEARQNRLYLLLIVVLVLSALSLVVFGLPALRSL